MSEFAAVARKLAGLAGAALGWRPDEFWDATPEGVPPDASDMTRLQEMFPDG